MPQRSVAANYTFEQQRVEINNLAADFWTHKTNSDNASSSYLKHDGSNNFTGGTLNVPNAFTISANSGAGTLTISGDLNVTGTTTTVNTTNLEVTDKNILIAKGNSQDSTADGAGITIDSATDITWNFVDAKDAWVSSIGVEGTTFVKGPYGQFTGSGTPTTGQGVEVNAPDANTGQIISYDRTNTAYKELRIKGSTVGVYTGTSNALRASFNANGLEIEDGDLKIPNDTGKVTIGQGSDLQLYHDGGSSVIQNINNNASLYLKASSTGTNNIKCDANSGTHLYWNGVLALYTGEDGNASGVPTVRIHDDIKLKFGNSSDFEIYHAAGGNSYIKEGGGGALVINADDFYLQNNATDTYLRTHSGGAIDLNYSGSKRVETTNEGITVSGETCIINRNAGDPYLAFQTSGTSNAVIYGGETSGCRIFTKPSGGSLTERLKVYPSGNVAIGLTNTGAGDADSYLQVNGTANTANLDLFRLRNTSGSAGTSCSIIFENGVDDMGRIQCYHDAGGSDKGGLKFWTAATKNTLTARMTINKDGKVGVGIEDPSQALLNVQSASGTQLALIKDNTGASLSLGGETQPRILIEAAASDNTLQIYTAEGSTYAGAQWEKKIVMHPWGGIELGPSSGYSGNTGFAVFHNAASGGVDKGTAGDPGAGDKGMVVRSDMGPTHTDLTGVDNFTLKLHNGAYAGSGIANPQGSIAKILFNTATYNGWNAYAGIACDTIGQSGGQGDLVFLTATGTSIMSERLRIEHSGARVSTSRSSSVKTYEFSYTDGAGGGTQTKNLFTTNDEGNANMSAVFVIDYVGTYGAATTQVCTGQWIGGIRRGTNGTTWNHTTPQLVGENGSGDCDLDVQWSNDTLQCVATAWMGWTVFVRVTIFNGSLTHNA